MASLSYSYVAQVFKPRESSEPILLFVAPASHIRGWAGVPRKAFDYQHGFQRTLQPNRVSEVAEFFLQDARNVSPTAVVVGFTKSIQVEPIEIDDGSEYVDLVRITVEVDDFSSISTEDLARQAMDRLRARLDDTVVAQIEANADLALSRAIDLENSETVDESFGIESETATDNGIEIGTTSYLGDFYARLLGFLRSLTPWPSDQDALREVLFSLIKPGIIVDGQHRVFGAATADEDMLLAVCAVPDATWAESVYQFVVINQKARPIKPAFLSAIIATSLNAEEIASVYGRLGASKIDVGRAEVMERVNTDPDSPFKGMIDFEVANSPGYLQFPGMTALTRDFHNISRTFPVLLPNADWGDIQGAWIDHFFAFWRGVRAYFEGKDGRLWQRPSEANPNNLLKIVTLQELQRLVVSTWADSRLVKLKLVADTESRSFEFWEGFPSEFFTDEWKKKGLQTSAGRQILSTAIMETRRNLGRRNWGHRRLGLFSD